MASCHERPTRPSNVIPTDLAKLSLRTRPIPENILSIQLIYRTVSKNTRGDMGIGFYTTDKRHTGRV